MIVESRSDAATARIALAQLCAAYRAPVLAYVRQHVFARDQAEDLTQEFFAHFLSEGLLHSADPERGHFRAYLLAAIRHFLNDSSDKARTLKRGAGVTHATLDESRVHSDTDQPERAFERRWALAVLQRAVARLGDEARSAGKGALFAELEEFLIEQPNGDDYERVAAKLGMRRNSLAVAVHRMRQRLRDLVRAELADTVATAADVEQEMRALREVLGGALSY